LATAPSSASNDQGDLVAKTGFDVLVEAVVGNVQLAVGEPLVERSVRFVEHLGERLLPDHMFPGQAAPVALVILLGFLAQSLVGGHAGNGGFLDGLFGRRKDAGFLHDRFDGAH